MENHGRVLRVDGAYAEVEVQPVSGGCGRCHEEGGCGSNLLNESLRPKHMSVYRLPNTIHAKAGDAVIINIAEGAVLWAALWAYLFPALLMIVGTALGTWSAEAGDERWPLLGAVAGLLLGVLALRWLPAYNAARNYSGLSMLRVGEGEAVSTGTCHRNPS